MSEAGEQKSTVDREMADRLIENGHGQYGWYQRETEAAERKLAFVTWAGIVAGLCASALAALPGDLIGKLSADITRYLAAVLTLFVTLFSGTLASKYRRLAIEREKGRVATALANNLTRLKLQFEPMTLIERGKLLASYESRLIEIEDKSGTIEPKPDYTHRLPASKDHD